MSQVTKDLGYRIMFDGSSCMIQDPTRGLMIGQGEEIANLYVLDTTSLPDSSNTEDTTDLIFCSNVVADTALWHNRLGHPALSKTDSLNDVLGLKERNKIHHCSVCHLAKQKHLRYISHNNICDHPFEMLHIDVWGPFSVPTPEGYKYFLTIVDDHTRVTWLYLLRSKDEVITIFPEFLQMVETQYKAVVKGVRSDNAPELRFTALFKKKGIVAYHSCPETPEQNSVVERKHQHILNVARSLMFQSQVPLDHWGDCVLTAVFLINRLPTPRLKNKTPFELLTSKKAVYSDLRVFGCLAYMSTSSKGRHKFQPRSRPCVFLGYPSGYKGYKLLDLESNKVHISRNVTFQEDIFPYAEEKPVYSEDFLNTDWMNMVPEKSHPTASSGLPKEVLQATGDSILPSRYKSKRVSKPPEHLSEYYCHLTATDVPYPLASYISFAKLSEGYENYICALSKHIEPASFTQAKRFDEWIKAMNEELIALESTDTWKIVSLPPGKHAIGCKWVYKVKLNADGTLQRYKARLVAKGYTQQEGVDFVDTFSPVAKMTTVKTLLAVSAAKNWSLTQLDISNAFLNGDLHEEIYMKLPPGYTPKQGESLPPNAVCKLQKSLYGLKQACRQWFLKFSSTLISMGFAKSQTDHTLFIKNFGGKYVAVLVYVDDIVIASNDDNEVEQLKANLREVFKLRDLGSLKFFLGLEIARSSKGISICQRKYILELLEETGLMACKPASIPMDPNVKLFSDKDQPILDDPTVYRRMVGRPMYLTITRPDITFAVNKLCQFASAPQSLHLKAAYRVLHYLKGTIGLGLFYSAESDLKLKTYTDADWGSCLDTRRSTYGFCMFLGTALIAWKSKKQDVASHSSAESEYRAMSVAVKEVVWIANLCRELQAPQDKPIAFFCDSTAAIHIANNPVFHERTKHVELNCHQVRDMICSVLIKTLHVGTASQLADVFTKPIFPTQFNALIGKMSLHSIYSPSWRGILIYER